MAMKLAVLFAIVLTSVSGVPLDAFYPFGFEAGDEFFFASFQDYEGEYPSGSGKFPTESDESPTEIPGSAPPITLSTPFVFFGVEQDILCVSEDGVISLNASVPPLTFEPFPLNEALIAPYWADADTRTGGYISYRETNETELLDRARMEIQSAFSNANQQTASVTHLFIATWIDVGYFEANRDKTNTFQCILATNGENSYVTFLYADDLIQWTTGDADDGFEGLGGNPARVGLNAGDGIHFVDVPGSQTSSVIDIVNTSNVCIGGMWIFRVDEPEFATVGSSSANNVFIPAFVEFTRNTSYFLNVSEDAYVGQTIGSVAAADLDSGPSGTLTFSIVGEGSERFRIDANTGYITLSITLDRESIERFDLSVIVQDQGEPSLSCSTSLTINVTDVNDNPPVFTEGIYEFSVFEEIFTVFLGIGNVTAEDRDSAENAETEYYLEEAQFVFIQIHFSTGEVIVVEPLDREFASEIVYTVTACNTEYPFECTSVPLLIRINDFNEYSPEFPQPTYRTNITQDYLVGTPLIRLTAYDSDAGSAGDITLYYILNDDSGLVDIEEDTGLIYLAREIQAADVGQAYNFSVFAEDGGFPLREGNCTAVIHVDDITVTRRFDTSYNLFTFPENNNTCNFTRQIPSTDLSGPVTFYPEAGTEFLLLMLSGNMQDIIQFNSFFCDAELGANVTSEYYTVVLQSENDNAFTSVTIQIIDENDNAPYFLLDQLDFTASENEMFSFSLGELVVDEDTDPDNRRVMYTLSGDEGIFGIDNNGVISLRSTLDREFNDFYTLSVRVANVEPPQLTATAVVRIRVLDQNDNAPVFHNVVTGKTRIQVFGGDFINDFYVEATDADTGENALVVLFLEDADTLPFAIDPVSGLLSVKDQEDSDNLEKRYSLVILAEDRGNPRLTSSATLDIQVFEEDELLVGVFPDVFISNGEFIGSSLEGTSILPTDSVVKAELPRDILISCSSVTATDVVWSSEGNITFRELTEDDLLGAMHNFDGSGSGSGRQTIVNDSIAGGADDFLTPVNGSFIFAMISSDAINEGTLECLSLQSGEKVALHFSSEFCMCALPNKMLQDVMQFCDSANFTTCSCPSSTFDCTCQQLTGDGEICTSDTDGDSFPNRVLPSCSNEEEIYCIEDNCPDDFNPDQNARACQEVVVQEGFQGCPAENDAEWNIEWSATLVGLFDTQPCIDGTVGNAIRLCISNQTWGSVNVTDCRSQEFEEIFTEVQEVLNDETLTTEEILEEIDTATVSLTNSTETEEGTQLYPQEIQATNEIVEDVIDFLIETVTEGITLSNLSTELVEVFDNILDEDNMDGWEQIEQSESGSQLLLNNAELYGLYVVEALTSTTVNVNPDEFQGLRGTQGNIVLDAEVQPADESLDDVSFLAGDISPGEVFSTTPRFGSARSQIRIPSALLMERAQADGSDMVSAVNIAMMNLEDFLPDSVIDEMESNATDNVTTVAAAIVLSSQIITSNSGQNAANGTFTTNAELVFTTNPVERASNPRCVFWNFGTTVAESGWSTDGVTTTETMYDEETQTFHVVCQSQHLTSFCVLVDVTGESDIPPLEARALEIVSYVGSSISMFFLLITIIFFLSFGKELFSSVHYFVHLNLSIALFLGYAAFVGGIETATSSEVGCVFVAALLQYLFVSVFCWMLCEGIMLYLLLVVVFSDAAKRWWMFALIGWGLPIIIVAVSVGVAHDQYGVRDDEGELQYCWIGVERGAIWGFVAPMLVVIAINTVVWLLALRALFKVTAAKMKDQQGVLARKLFLAAVVLLPLLGLTWVFGLLSVNADTTAFSWLFAIFNSLQGLFVFIFHVLRNEKVWKKLFGKRKPDVSRSGTTTSRYQSSVKRTTTRKKNTHKKSKKKKNDDLLLSSDAVIVFENPDWKGGPFEVTSNFDEIDLTTRTWIDD